MAPAVLNGNFLPSLDSAAAYVILEVCGACAVDVLVFVLTRTTVPLRVDESGAS